MNKIELHKGDCLKVMDSLIERGIIFDAIICDPPFGTTQNKWDSVIPFDEMWLRLNKLIKPNGAIVLFGSEPFSSALRMSNIKNYKYDWKYKKTQPTGFLNAKKQPLRYTEDIIVFYKKQCVYNAQLRDKDPKNIRPRHSGKQFRNNGNYGDFKHGDFRDIDIDKSYPSNIIEFNNPQSSLHPTQKPVTLMEYLIKTYTNENELVLDFTMGSATTVVAGMNTNRSVTGIENDNNYFDISENRVMANIYAANYDIKVFSNN